MIIDASFSKACLATNIPKGTIIFVQWKVLYQLQLNMAKMNNEEAPCLGAFLMLL